MFGKGERHGGVGHRWLAKGGWGRGSGKEGSAEGGRREGSGRGGWGRGDKCNVEGSEGRVCEAEGEGRLSYVYVGWCCREFLARTGVEVVM